MSNATGAGSPNEAAAAAAVAAPTPTIAMDGLLVPTEGSPSRRGMPASRSVNDIAHVDATQAATTVAAAATQADGAGTTRRVDSTLRFKKRLSMTGSLFFKSNVDFLAHLDRTSNRAERAPRGGGVAPTSPGHWWCKS